MGREAYLTFCLIPFSNPFFRTNLECKQGRKGLKSPYLIQQKKPDLSSDRDSIAVDRGRARITFSIRIRKGIALIATAYRCSLAVKSLKPEVSKGAYERNELYILISHTEGKA